MKTFKGKNSLEEPINLAVYTDAQVAGLTGMVEGDTIYNSDQTRIEIFDGVVWKSATDDPSNLQNITNLTTVWTIDEFKSVFVNATSNFTISDPTYTAGNKSLMVLFVNPTPGGDFTITLPTGASHFDGDDSPITQILVPEDSNLTYSVMITNAGAIWRWVLLGGKSYLSVTGGQNVTNASNITLNRGVTAAMVQGTYTGNLNVDNSYYPQGQVVNIANRNVAAGFTVQIVGGVFLTAAGTSATISVSNSEVLTMIKTSSNQWVAYKNTRLP